MTKTNTKSYCESFHAVIPSHPTWMVLGTMPSVESLKHNFYYAHPRNAFWPILQTLIGGSIDSQKDKIALTDKAGLVVWDVLANCERPGSLDSAIKNPQANQFDVFFKTYPTVKTVVFNGKKAEQLFTRYVIKQQVIPQDIEYWVMPSTSPANAAISLEDKRLFWQEKLSHLV